MRGLKGKNVLVTGGASGIGQATATRFLEEGCAVCVLDRSPDARTRVAEELPDLAAVIDADVADMSQVRTGFQEAIDCMGTVDVLVNNAGILLFKPALEITADEFSQVLAVNVTGTYLLSQQMARQLIDAGRPGCIVNIASTFTTIGAQNVSAYGVSKAAVGGITRHLAVEWAQYGIRVNAVAPGSVKTKLRAELMAANPERAVTNMAKIPMQRWGTPEDMAGAVVYLASPAADYITGHVLAVDGGLTIS